MFILLNCNFCYSQALRVGDVIYVSGTLGLDKKTGELVPGGVGPETEQAMVNIKYILKHAHSSVSSCTFRLVARVDLILHYCQFSEKKTRRI